MWNERFEFLDADEKYSVKTKMWRIEIWIWPFSNIGKVLVAVTGRQMRLWPWVPEDKQQVFELSVWQKLELLNREKEGNDIVYGWSYQLDIQLNRCYKT